MSDRFDLSDFDAPVDDLVVLDAIRDAAASGVQAATGPLVAAVETAVRRQMRGRVLMLVIASFAAGLVLAGVMGL